MSILLDPFIRDLERDPEQVHVRLRARAMEAVRRGESTFAFPELAPTVERMVAHLSGLRANPPPAVTPERLDALRAEGEVLLRDGVPYHRLIRYAVAFVEAVDLVVRARHPDLPVTYVTKCREELPHLLALWPEILAFPTFSTLDRRYFLVTRPVPLFVLGLVTEPLYADGQVCSPAEYLFHDLDHLRFCVREELLAQGAAIPDAYQAAEPYAPATTWDPVTGRHRIFLDVAAARIAESPCGTPERIQPRRALARRLLGSIAELAHADASLAEACELLLFEVVHEKGYPMDAAVLRHQLSSDAHPAKLRRKLDAGFYGPGFVSDTTASRLDQARGWLHRQVE